MSEWSSVSISESCEILDSRRIPVNEEVRNSRQGNTPYYGANGLQGFIDGFIFDEPLILIAEDGGYFDEFASRPIAYRINGKSWVNNHAHILRSKAGFDQNFIFYCLEHKDVTPFIKGGTRAKLNQSELRQITIPSPPPPQQRKIARILTTVDNLIEKTEALIAKYQAMKQGMMHDLFTRGMDEHGHLRPPYEEAPELYKESELGWIPKEWEIDIIDNLLERIIDYRGKTPTKTDSGVPLITAKNVRMGFIDSEPEEFIAEDSFESWMTRGFPVKGDVLFTTEAPLGNVAQITTDERLAFAQRIIILQANQRLQNAFLKYLLMTDSPQRWIRIKGTGSTVEGIKQTVFRRLPLAFPKQIKEQRSIVMRLETLEHRFEIEQVALGKFRLFKSGLMQDLLTGKVRVKVDEAEEVASV